METNFGWDCRIGNIYNSQAVIIRANAARSGVEACHPNTTPLHRIVTACIAALEALSVPGELEAAAASLSAHQERSTLEARLDTLAGAVERMTQERERLTTVYLRGILGVDEYEKRMAGLAEGLVMGLGDECLTGQQRLVEAGADNLQVG